MIGRTNQMALCLQMCSHPWTLAKRLACRVAEGAGGRAQTPSHTARSHIFTADTQRLTLRPGSAHTPASRQDTSGHGAHRGRSLAQTARDTPVARKSDQNTQTDMPADCSAGACCVQKLDVSQVLRIAPRFASRCVLHRYENQMIPCRQLCTVCSCLKHLLFRACHLCRGIWAC